MRSVTEAVEFSGVAARLPAQDLNRARTFYAEKLDLEPIEERPPGGSSTAAAVAFSPCLLPVGRHPGAIRR